jgi:hypothetical protein
MTLRDMFIEAQAERPFNIRGWLLSRGMIWGAVVALSWLIQGSS